MSTKEELNEALLQASKEGNLELVKSLISQGADVNVKDKENATSLMRAVSRNYEGIVKELLEKGADVNAVNNWGYSPLKYTQKLNLKEMENILREAGATD